MVVNLEAHTLRVRPDLWCPDCHRETRTEVDLVIVSDDLTPIGRFTGSSCSHCGATTAHRT